MGVLLDKVALGHVLIWVHLFSTLSIIPPILRTRLHLQYSLQKEKRAQPGYLATKLMLCLKSGSIKIEKLVLSLFC
jgi:hypothetical protein